MLNDFSREVITPIFLDSREGEPVSPTRVFKYLPDIHMCASGQVRAAIEGFMILNGLLDPLEHYQKAKESHSNRHKSAPVDKKHLVTAVVYHHFMRGHLEDFVNQNGDFMLNHKPSDSGFVTESVNVFTHPQTQRYIRKLFPQYIDIPLEFSREELDFTLARLFNGRFPYEPLH